MAKDSSKPLKLSCLLCASSFNFLLTVVTICYLGYSISSLNKRVTFLEGKLEQTDAVISDKRSKRSVGHGNPTRSCAECKKDCLEILGKGKQKVSKLILLSLQKNNRILKLPNFNLYSFFSC